MLYLCEKQMMDSNVMKRPLANYETSNEAGVKVECRIPEPAL